MVPSPALVPSPSAQQILLANQQRSIGKNPLKKYVFLLKKFLTKKWTCI